MNHANDESRFAGGGAAGIAILAVLASATSLGNGFAYDDRLLILNNPRAHAIAHIGRVWTQTYWPPWMGSGLYRPLTMSAFVIQWWLGHGSPWVFHAVSVLLYAAVSLLVLALARQLLPPIGAYAAAALFAVHPVHVEAVGNVVGQAELWAACGVVGAAVVFIRSRRHAVANALSASGRFARVERAFGADVLGGLRQEALLLVLIVAACCAKEHAVVTPALLVLAEVFAVDDPRPWRDRWRSLRPLVLTITAVVLAYVALRTAVVGAFAGDRPNVLLEHLTPAARRWTMLGVSSEWTRLLAWPWHLAIEYAPQDIAVHDRFDLALVPSATLLAVWGVVLVVAIARWRPVAFGLLWTVVTLMLVSNLLVPTGVLLAERTLFLPSVGAMLVAGAIVGRLVGAGWGAAQSVDPGRPRWIRRAIAAAVVVGLMAGLWRSAHRQRVWRSNDTVFAQAPLDSPLSYRAHDLYAGLLFDHGDKAGGEREARLALALYPHDAVLYRDLAQEYMRAGLCPAAIPLLRRAIAEQGSLETDAHLLLAECLLAQHDPESARDEVLRGTAHGYYPYYGAGYHKVLLAVDSALSGHRPTQSASMVAGSLMQAQAPVLGPQWTRSGGGKP